MQDDSTVRYGTVSRLLHSLIAVLVLWQALKVFDRIDDGEHWVGQTLVSWHISIGALILLLMLPRIYWAIRNRNNRPPAEAGLLGFLAKAGHLGIYAFLLLLPITGILIMLGNGYGLTVFGLELVAGGGAEIPWMASLGGALHSPAALLFLLMLGGHIVMAFWHHFVRKDGLLNRMF